MSESLDSRPFCDCMEGCRCKCLESVEDYYYEKGWLDCWKFFTEFFKA